MFRPPELAALIDDLKKGRTTSVALCQSYLDRIQDPGEEGNLVFVHVDPDRVLADAAEADEKRVGRSDPALLGIPISVKDLFDVKGQVTTAGSRVLADSEPAEFDAPIVTALRNSGAVIIGRTNMTEFAYSGLGLNPHYGTPRNPFDPKVPRIPGGSSSGAGVSVSAGMAAAAIGTDTGGSVRIPAAVNGLTGFKPTVARVSTEGAYPLSTTFDSIGPLAPTVRCCTLLDGIMSGAPLEPQVVPLNELTLGLPANVMLESLDEAVEKRFEAAIRAIEKAGVTLVDVPTGHFAERQGAEILGFEAYARHKELLATRASEYDHRVSGRIQKWADLSEADYQAALQWQRRFALQTTALFEGIDAMVCPTTAILPPSLERLVDDEDYYRSNGRILRNTTIVNQMGGCALTIPCDRDALPLGLMVFGPAMRDRRILEVGMAIEATVRAVVAPG